MLYCIDSSCADEFASVINKLCDIFSKLIISEIVYIVETKDTSAKHNQVGEY